MMRLLSTVICALLLILTVTCVREDSSDVAHLREEVLKLKETVETLKPGLGEIMSAIQQHHEKLYFSGQRENWELAQYEMDEISENLDRGTHLYEHFKDLKVTLNELKHLTDSSIKQIKKSINEKNPTKFIDGFNNLTQSCNQCHEAAQHSFIRIQTPTNSAMSNQRF